MTGRLLHLIGAVACLLLAFVMTACSDSAAEFMEPAADSGENVGAKVYRAGFYINVGGLPDNSRATPSGNYYPGEGVENYIDLESPMRSNLKVILYDLNDNLLGEMTDLIVTPLDSYDSSKRYHIEGATTADISTGRFKVMVLANWPSYPETPDMESVFACQFEFSGELPSKERPIPFYGIRAVEFSGVKPGVTVNIGTIHLLRALAKIEVTYNDQSGQWNLSDIFMTSYNKRGLCAPAVRNQSDYVKDDWNRDYLDRVYVPSEPGRDENLFFHEVESGRRWLLYMPEYCNSMSGAPMSRICVDFENESAGRHYIELRDPAVSDVVSTDIKRNVWYKVAITKLHGDAELKITVDVQPYASVELDPDFGLERDEEGDLVNRDKYGYLTDADGNHVDAYGNPATLIMVDGKPVRFVDFEGYTLNKDGFPLDADGTAGYRDEESGYKVVRNYVGYIMDSSGLLIDADGNRATRDESITDRYVVRNHAGYIIDYEGHLIDCDGMPAVHDTSITDRYVVRDYDGYLLDRDGMLVDADGNRATRGVDGLVRRDSDGRVIDRDGNPI